MGRASRARRWRVRGTPARLAAFALAYYLLARLSYAASLLPEGAMAAWWVPSGLALGVLVRTRRGHYVWYLLAIGLVAAVINASQSPGLVPLLYRTLADVLEPLASSWVLRRQFGRALRMGTLREVLWFGVAGCVLGPVVGGSVVALGALVANPTELSAGMIGLAWFGGGTLGVMLFAPVLLTWRGRFRRIPALRLAEVSLLGVALAAVVLGAYFIGPTLSLSSLFGFAAFPPLIWAALRFGPSGAARAAVALSVFSLVPYHGWQAQALPWQVLVSQGIYAVGVFSALCVSALVSETFRQRKRAQAHAQRAEQSLKLLEKALSEAREALQLREDFLSIASHELKTPLTPLAARLTFLQRKLAAGETLSPQSIDKPLASLRKLTELINDLLDTSQIEHGRLQLRPEPLPLQEVVRMGAEPYQAESALHRLEVEAPPEPLWVEADRQRLTQVVSNLVDNAIKYSPSGGEVRLRVSPHPEGVELTVSDQGIGIPQDQQGRLFDRFYRAANASVSSYGGLGLGLYITHDIVERHRGRIWVESKLGQGSTFHVVLPRLERAELSEALH